MGLDRRVRGGYYKMGDGNGNRVQVRYMVRMNGQTRLNKMVWPWRRMVG